MNYKILTIELLKIGFYGMVGWLCGIWVLRKSVKVNYTRKINFFTLFLVPILVDRIFPYEPSFEDAILCSAFFIAFLILFIKPIRERISPIRTIFLSWDRPEDQPYTLFWLSTQLIAGYAVLIPMNVIFKQFQFSNLIFIPVLVQGIGDGLAEPVGVRFGKHKYLTKGFLTNRLYTRSIEGSACIFIVGIFAIIFFKSNFDAMQFIAALLTVPIFMTVAEAISPHTWDTPLMYLSGFGALFGIKIFI